MGGLTLGEVTQVVNRYIGVSGGYLGDFSYRTHAEFYPEYCDLEIDPYAYDGTTRERFIEILSSRSPRDQAKILAGVLERFPVESELAPTSRVQMASKIKQWIDRLQTSDVTLTVNDEFSAKVVREALHDAEVLLRDRSSVSAVDRVHTALHGYLKEKCREAQIEHAEDASTTALFKVLRNNHPALQDLGPRTQDIKKVMNSAAAILDALGPLRNRGSMAHPNQDLLDPEEATLVVNIGKSLIGYLSAKLDAGDEDAGEDMSEATQVDLPF
jgi:hypothetical protein